MKRFVEGMDRGQGTLFPAVLDDYVGEDNPVRAIDVFVDGLDLAKLGFDGVAPLATGRPAYHPAPLLKILVEAMTSLFTGQPPHLAWLQVAPHMRCGDHVQAPLCNRY